jgi:hypothetical protein
MPIQKDQIRMEFGRCPKNKTVIAIYEDMCRLPLATKYLTQRLSYLSIIEEEKAKELLFGFASVLEY